MPEKATPSPATPGTKPSTVKAAKNMQLITPIETLLAARQEGVGEEDDQKYGEKADFLLPL